MKFRISIKLLLASLIISLTLGICNAFIQYLVLIIPPLNDVLMGAIVMEIGIIGSIINPIAIFVVFYLIGKKFDLKNMLGTAILSIFIGLIIGYFLTNLLNYQLINNRPDVTNPMDIFTQLWTSLGLSIQYSIGTFFVVFASLALGYLRRKERVTGE